MGIKALTQEEYELKVYNKYGNKVSILSDYVNGLTKIKIEYHCDKHGISQSELNAKNVFAPQFNPCIKCRNEKKSGIKKPQDKNYYLNKLKEKCEKQKGTLISTEYITAKTTYEFKCKNPEHPTFFTTADCVISKHAWCPYCAGRKDNFNQKMIEKLAEINCIALEEYKTSAKHILVKCNVHSYEWKITPMNIFKGRGCPVCNLPHSEKVVYDYLTNNQYYFKIQYKFNDLIGNNNEKYKFDFAIFKKEDDSLRYLLEIDDCMHRYKTKNKEKLAMQQRDRNKDKYCKDNDLDLHRIEFLTHNKEFKEYEWYYNYIKNKINEIEMRY